MTHPKGYKRAMFFSGMSQQKSTGLLDFGVITRTACQHIIPGKRVTSRISREVDFCYRYVQPVDCDLTATCTQYPIFDQLVSFSNCILFTVMYIYQPHQRICPSSNGLIFISTFRSRVNSRKSSLKADLQSTVCSEVYIFLYLYSLFF
jgi:hypothetical protein